MNFKQTTIEEILDSEREMVLKGSERYGEYFDNATNFNNFLIDFLESVDHDRFIFAIFLSNIRKHLTLALFSAVRLHHIQAMMNMRQVLESGACAAYAIANTNAKDFADVDDNGILNSSSALTKKRYDWLKTNYPAGSSAIENMKRTINRGSAHANIADACRTFSLDATSKKFNTPFFDIAEEYHIKTDLWMVGNVVMGLVDLFYGVNKGRDVIKFIDNFIPRLRTLERQNKKLKEEVAKKIPTLRAKE